MWLDTFWADYSSTGSVSLEYPDCYDPYLYEAFALESYSRWCEVMIKFYILFTLVLPFLTGLVTGCNRNFSLRNAQKPEQINEYIM